MLVKLTKFGTTLLSRAAGREAFAALASDLPAPQSDETIVVDFADIHTFSPSWGDEFLTPLLKKYGERLLLLRNSNPSVETTIEVLEATSENHFKIVDSA